MNLTCSPYFRWILLSAKMLSFYICVSQPISTSLPTKYHYLLEPSPISSRIQTHEYIVPRSEVNSERTWEIVRRLDGWAIVRPTNEQALGIDNALLVNPLWKLSHRELLTYEGSQLITLKLANFDVISSFSSVLYQQYPYAKVMATTKEILAILGRKDVLYIGMESHLVSEESRVLDLNLIPNNLPMVNAHFSDLEGDQLNVAIKENLFDENDPDIKGRTGASNWASEEMSNHATEMATIIGGAGITFVNGRGVAPKVQLYSSGFDNLLPDVDWFYKEQKIVIQNHSYGGVVESFYGVGAEAYDRTSIKFPTILHVMSSGNSGMEVPDFGTYQGVGAWANLTGNYKNSKNNIVVGAVDTTGVLMPFSSVGPAADGRIKPEIVAYSTAGTSNSAALVSGVCVLLQELYSKKFDTYAPSDLIKALLINGARDVGESGIDFRTGFGKVDAYASMNSLDKNNFFIHTVVKDKMEQLDFDVPIHAIDLKVSLVWNDPAGLANDTKPLVNDLDLKLIDPDGKIWLPWVLDHSAHVVSLEAQAIRAEDHLNNVEQVSIAAPMSGAYKILIDGQGLSTDLQNFSLVFSYQLTNKFEWEYPLKQSNMPYDGETGSYFRWKSTFGVEYGELYLTMDDGESWILLSSKLDLDKEYFRWEPKGLNGLARAKIRIGTQEFETDNFMISSALRVGSGFYCADSTMIHWLPQKGAEAYEIMQLVDNGFQRIRTVSDTFDILAGDELKTGYFKVIPKFSNLGQGIGSYLFSPEDIGSDCFLTSFFGYKNEEGVLLSTNLTSLYGVKSVHIESLKDDEFQMLHNYSIDQQTLLEYQDLLPKEGANSYRAQVSFDNGSELTSDTVQLIYLDEMTALLYPNPVQYGSLLAIQTNLSDDKQSALYIFDLQGNQVAQGQISQSEYLPVRGNLIPGLYLYTIENEKGSTRGKLVIY